MSQIAHTQQWMVMAVLAVICGLAVRSDLQSRRIPNPLIVRGIVLAGVIHVVAGIQLDPIQIAIDWKTPVLGLLAGFAALLPLYLMRACGAGDVKLMAMVGAFVGPTTVLYAALYTLLAGGVLSLVYMLVKGVAAQTLRNVQFLLTDLFVRASSGGSVRLDPLATTAARLPYAVAIAAGTGMALLQRAGIV